MAKIMVENGTPRRSSWANFFFGHPWAGFYGKDNLRKSFWSTTERRFPIGNAYSYTMKIFLSVSVDEMKWAGKKQNITPMWKVLNKEVDLGEPTSFFDHVHLACTQRQCEISKDTVDNYRTMFESRISARATVKLPCSENLRISSWSVTWKGISRNVWNDIVSWRTRRLNNSTKYQLHASMTTTSKKKWNPWENCPKNALNFSEMQILGMYWKTGYSVVSEQTLHDPSQNGQSLWQTIFSFDLSHSSYMWLQPILSCEKHCQTLQIVTVSRLRFCMISWGFKFYIKWNIVHLRKPYVCSNQLDV